MNVLLIQPPLVQLNSPYPAGAYLSAFFKKMGCGVKWKDFSNELFNSIFSSRGLSLLFSLTEKSALKMADKAFYDGDENTAFNIRRYVMCQESWINWIDSIVGILCGKMREKEHEFLYSPYAPRGSRMENFLANLDRDPTVDDVRFLCSYALADLADYITAVFDNNFSLIRYAEALTVDESSFAQIEKQIDSPVMEYFYKPVLDGVELDTLWDKSWQAVSAGCETDNAPESAPVNCGADTALSDKILIGISVPFAGTFTPALYTARYFKQKFGDKVFVVLGGGFVNTELREASDSALCKYVDAICYDRGYGAFKELLESGSGNGQLYKLRQFCGNKVIEPLWQGSKQTLLFEEKMTSQIVPDFSDIDFSLYPRLCDDKNPMQRMWSDGAWIKAYMAHGCYWHKCAFCDTQLDYVCSYKMTDVENLYNGLRKTALQKGVRGIHFVDEALPPAALKRFAVMNCREQEGQDSNLIDLASKKSKLTYWGNVRFEKSFTYDLAALLSYGGLSGVSAGLEVATGEGLENINKGTDLNSVVSACAAFKEAGILVHAYMIYGFWNDTAQNIINSMETLRQFFAAGLLDSAFWHKFMLTKNSTVMAEWNKGLYPELKPVFNKEKSMFAKNCIHFEGERKYEKYGAALDNALNSWMHGQRLETKVTKWFDFEVPSPTVPKNLIEKAIENYEASKSAKIKDFSKADVFWLGSKLVQVNSNQYSWIYLQEEQIAPIQKDLAQLLWQLRPSESESQHQTALEKIKKSPELQKQIQKLRGIGLIII